MTQASSLEKEKAKALEKAALAKASPRSQRLLALKDGEVDPPTEEPEAPSEEQILAQTRKQASKAEAMVHKLQRGAGPNLGKGLVGCSRCSACVYTWKSCFAKLICL